MLYLYKGRFGLTITTRISPEKLKNKSEYLRFIKIL